MKLSVTQIVFQTTVATLYLFFVHVKGAALKLPEDTTQTNVNGTEDFSKVEETRVDLVYNSSNLKEINHDGILKLQVIGDASLVEVNCQYTGNVSEDRDAFVDWTYEGLEKIDPFIRHNSAYIIFNTGSPVAGMKCVLQNKTLTPNSSNVTLIYRGDDKPPYLYNHGKTVNKTVFNESLVRLPCVLKYPVDNDGHEIKIQLLKDGVEVDKNLWRYVPEHGFLLSIRELENSYGEYKCKVVNSTEGDFVSIELREDDFIRAKVRVSKLSPLDTFYVGDSILRIFQCSVPKPQFQNKFNWFYSYSNGTLEKIQSGNVSSNSSHYTNKASINFPSANITRVVCVGYLNDTFDTSYNNSVTVKVKEPIMPIITKRPPYGPVIYKNGMNLTCEFQGEPITGFSWTKNGKVVASGLHHNFPAKTTTHILDPPTYNEGESTYICTATNFLGNTSHTYKVKLPEPEDPSSSPTLGILVGVLTVAAVIIVAVLIIFKVHLKRRRFDPEKIRLFFSGTKPEERSNNDYSNNPDQLPEPVDSVPYDRGHEISPQSLNVDKELKRGHFGKVELGIVTDRKTGKRTKVAIKSIINDREGVTPEELDYEFENFLKEIKRSQILGREHLNVVGYIGAVTADLSQYSAYLVVEYCTGGDIRTLLGKGGMFYDELRGEHHDFPCRLSDGTTTRSMSGLILKTSHLMRWAEEAASGMEYIHSKGLVHRDIAIRNILLAIHPDHNQDCECLDPSILIAKISDFGLSKDLHELLKDYYQIVIHADPQQNRPHPLPLRWLALESLETLRFTRESDYWTFGIALYELFTLGGIPYEHEISRNYGGDLRSKLLSHLRNNENILPEPDFVPSEIWEIMNSCWNTSPDQRPNFRDMKERLHEVNLEFNDVNNAIDSNSEGEQNVEYTDVATVPAATEGYSSISAVQNVAYDMDGDSESGGESDDTDYHQDDSDSAGMNGSYEDDEGNMHEPAPEYLSVVTVSRITCDEEDKISEDRNRDSNYNSLEQVQS